MPYPWPSLGAEHAGSLRSAQGFHQPLNDFRSDASIGSTLLRELEEELFQRADVDNTISAGRIADPMHPNRLSEPMRWLMRDPGRIRFECTGFGFNLVNGNFEYACLVDRNPVPALKWKPPRTTHLVDRRVVANPGAGPDVVWPGRRR